MLRAGRVQEHGSLAFCLSDRERERYVNVPVNVPG